MLPIQSDAHCDTGTVTKYIFLFLFSGTIKNFLRTGFKIYELEVSKFRVQEKYVYVAFKNSVKYDAFQFNTRA